MIPIDLCQSTYNHVKYEHFGDKKFYKKHNSADIVCSECLGAWMNDSSRILVREILRRVIPIWYHRKDIFRNARYGLSEPGIEIKIPENLDPGFTVEPENQGGCCGGHQDYEIPGDTLADEEKEEIKDLYPMLISPEEFTPEQLTGAPEIYDQYFNTNMTVDLPEYMKYILCSQAQVAIISTHMMMYELTREISKVTVTFPGPTKRPQSTDSFHRDTSDCGCSGSTSQNSSGCSCDHSAPKPPLHQFTLSIYPQDLCVKGYLESRIHAYLDLCIEACFDLIPPFIVKALMEDAFHHKYHDHATSDSGFINYQCTCQKCNRTNVYKDYYIYRGKTYCVDCMYDIVVDLAVNANLAEQVGLATGKDTYSLDWLYRDTTAWKKAVIGRYINAMKAAGANPEIKPMPKHLC